MLLTSRKESAFVGQSAFCGILLFEAVAKRPAFRGGDRMVTKPLKIVTKTVTISSPRKIM